MDAEKFDKVVAINCVTRLQKVQLRNAMLGDGAVQGGRKIYRSELRLFSSAISPTFLLSLIFQLQMSFHLLYPPCALRKPARKKRTYFRRNHNFQMVKQKSSVAFEFAMAVETARD